MIGRVADEPAEVVRHIRHRHLLEAAHRCFMPPEALLDLIDYVVDSCDLPMLDVQLDAPRPIGTFFSAHGGLSDGVPFVHLPHPDQCSLGVALHELAHALVPWAGHGPAFASQLDTLLLLTEGGWPRSGNRR